MESERGSSKHSTMHTEPSHDNGNPVVKEKMSRSSSSSSASSFDPLLDSDDGENDVLDNSINKSEQDVPGSPRARAIALPEVSAQTAEWSMSSPSQSSGPESFTLEHSPPTPEWSMLTASPKQSPPVQMMGRPVAGYDPNRIPSSIFASKPATPMEWSVASNESLFSLHMGNNSFSRDHVFLFGRSGELMKPDELNNYSSSQQLVSDAKSNESANSPSSLPTVSEVESDNHTNASMVEDFGVKEAADGNPNVAMKKTAESHSKESMPPAEGVLFSTSASNKTDSNETPPADARNSSSTPRLSDESGNSCSSFAFPVLTGEGGRTGSVKTAPVSSPTRLPEKPESKPQQDEAVIPKPAETRWLSCFSCPSCWSPCC